MLKNNNFFQKISHMVVLGLPQYSKGSKWFKKTSTTKRSVFQLLNNFTSRWWAHSLHTCSVIVLDENALDIIEAGDIRELPGDNSEPPPDPRPPPPPWLELPPEAAVGERRALLFPDGLLSFVWGGTLGITTLTIQREHALWNNSTLFENNP